MALRFIQLRIEVGQQRQRECSSLAGAGLRLPEDITAFQ